MRIVVTKAQKFLLACVVLMVTLNQATAEEQKKRALLNVQERKKEKSTQKAAPQLNRSAVVTVQVEKKLIEGIDKTVSYLQKTSAGLPKKSAPKLQLLERILNLRMEQATYVRSEEERNYDKAWRAWSAADKKTRGKEPQLSSAKSNGHWRDVINEATAILKEFPRSKNADIVTFNQAVGLQYIGKEKEAAKIYTQLIQRYPNSNVAGDAFASLGDFYFDRNDFRNAQSNYTKALKYKRSNRYLWSIFKSGWCDFNLGNYKQALKYWKQLVAQAAGGNAGALNLREEALRDMVYAFAELRDIEGAIAYYRANNGDVYIGQFLVLLGQILADQGNYAQAISVYKRFQKVAPMDPGGPESQKEIISLYYALNNLDSTWKELARFAPMYGDSSEWASKQKKEDVVETQAMIKDQILYYATLTHQKAIKDENIAMNKEARRGYLLFLQSYPRAAEVPGVKYYLADIEYYLKNYRDAGRYYLEIASLGKDKAVRIDAATKKPQNMHKEASIEMVRSFVKDFEPEFKVLKKRTPDFKEPKPISVRAKNYIKACALYVKWYPGDKEKEKTCETDITKIYYHNGHKPNAVRYLKMLAVKYSKDKEGPASVELLIPMVKDDKKELLTLSEDLLKIPAYQKGELGDKLRALQRASEKESVASEKDGVKRAKKYEELARKYPKDPDADKLWYNAAVDYTKAGELAGAIAAYSMLVKNYPNSAQAQESLLQIAKVYEKQLEFVKASSYFVMFNTKYPKAKEAAGALAKSCELLIAVDSEKSTSTCMAFIQRYPDGASTVVERLIKGAERKKDNKRMVDLTYNSYLGKFKLSPNQRIVALYRVYKADDEGKGPLSIKAAREIEQVYGSSPGAVDGEALRYVGELAFKRANAIMSQFQNVKLQGGTVDKLAASLEQKAVALAQLEKTYNTVVATKDAYWGVAAIYQMGFANEMYAEAMMNPPTIQGASKEDVVKELGAQIEARKKAGLTWYKTAQETVTKFRVYNEWSVRVINGLARLSGRNFVFDDYVVKPDFLGTEMPSSLSSSLRGGE